MKWWHKCLSHLELLFHVLIMDSQGMNQDEFLHHIYNKAHREPVGYKTLIFLLHHYNPASIMKFKTQCAPQKLPQVTWFPNGIAIRKKWNTSAERVASEWNVMASYEIQISLAGMRFYLEVKLVRNAKIDGDLRPRNYIANEWKCIKKTKR